VTQYDAEVWLRIEHALGRKLDELEGIIKEEVKILADRVNEAQTVAKKELRDAQEKGSRKGGIGRGTHKHGRKRHRDEQDAEEG